MISSSLKMSIMVLAVASVLSACRNATTNQTLAVSTVSPVAAVPQKSCIPLHPV